MNNQLTVAQILGAIQRHRFKALLAWALVMVCVVILYVIWPRQYSSEGRLYVKMDRNNQSVVPSTSGGQVAIQDTRETEIRSVIEIIRSHAVLDAVVDAVGSKKILESGMSDMLPSLSFLKSPFGDSKGEMDAKEYKRLRKREQASKAILENMDVYNEKKSSVLVVTVRASSPKLAQEIVQQVFENTRKIHTRIHNVSSSVDFFDEQFISQEDALKKSVSELAEFRNELGVMSVSAARGSLQSVISSLDLGLVNADVTWPNQKTESPSLKR